MDDLLFFSDRLIYVHETGKFFWKNTDLVAPRVRGKEAGTINAKGYCAIGVKRDGKLKVYKAHRIAWLLAYGFFPAVDIDHINGDKTDNRISNLREASVSLNNQNIRRPRRHNKLGVLGVSKSKGKYLARICLDGENIVIGRYETVEEAHSAYLTAKREMHRFCEI